MANLKDKSTKDLEKLLVEERETVRTFRFGVAGSRVRNVKEGRNTKKNIARILTEIAARKNTQ